MHGLLNAIKFAYWHAYAIQVLAGTTTEDENGIIIAVKEYKPGDFEKQLLNTIVAIHNNLQIEPEARDNIYLKRLITECSNIYRSFVCGLCDEHKVLVYHNTAQCKTFSLDPNSNVLVRKDGQFIIGNVNDRIATDFVGKVDNRVMEIQSSYTSHLAAITTDFTTVIMAENIEEAVPQATELPQPATPTPIQNPELLNAPSGWSKCVIS